MVTEKQMFMFGELGKRERGILKYLIGNKTIYGGSVECCLILGIDPEKNKNRMNNLIVEMEKLGLISVQREKRRKATKINLCYNWKVALENLE